MKITIEVSNEDIAGGCSGVYNECPIARALLRFGCENIDADEDRILLTYKGNRYVFTTPRIANLFIDDFDHDREVMPISFTLEKPRLATPEDERQPVLKISRS